VVLHDKRSLSATRDREKCSLLFYNRVPSSLPTSSLTQTHILPHHQYQSRIQSKRTSLTHYFPAHTGKKLIVHKQARNKKCRCLKLDLSSKVPVYSHSPQGKLANASRNSLFFCTLELIHLISNCFKSTWEKKKEKLSPIANSTHNRRIEGENIHTHTFTKV
jgi:hypothetical protein